MPTIPAVPANGLRSRFASLAVAATITAAVAFTVSCAREQPSPDPAGGSRERSVAAQKRLNRHFHDQVVPKLGECWQDIHGRGAVEMWYSFTRGSNGAWAVNKVEAGESSLPGPQKAAALACMQKAVTSTSFPASEGDDPETYFVAWNWPVPLPADAAQQADRMFKDNGGGGTGCDGNGAPARCWNCTGSGTVSCAKVCVGYSQCSIVNDQYPLPHCSAKGACASGGPFGVLGGNFIY
jgi:hypothetical protein